VSAAHRLFTDGSAYATMPANVPAHNLAALTISFYYQRESSGGKQILLAAGKGSQAGDFSFRGAGGRTAAGLAHRPGRRAALLRQHHPQGARLYLDGTQVVAAAISQNTNGWNNTRVKYLGLWTDGVQAPAFGAFDRLRIWNRELSNVAKHVPFRAAWCRPRPKKARFTAWCTTGVARSAFCATSRAGNSPLARAILSARRSHPSRITASRGPDCHDRGGSPERLQELVDRP
jgi:hypothetical protein